MGEFGIWTEVILLSIAFVAVLGFITADFNILYDQDHVMPFVDNSGAEELFIQYQNTSQQQIQGGEVDFSADQGITLKSSWALAKAVVGIIWNFVSGGWIEQIVGAWNLGEAAMALARAMRIIWFLGLVFALLYALFKIPL